FADPDAVAAALSGLPTLDKDARLYVAWEVDLAANSDSATTAAQAERLAKAGAAPWLRLIFHTASPVAAHLAELDGELKAAAALARAASSVRHFAILWQPASAPPEGIPPGDYAFLFKRAGVAVSGAQADARVISQALPPSRDALAAFYAGEVAAYLDGLALGNAPEAELAPAFAALEELDPGRPVVLEGLDFPANPAEALARAADAARLGASIALFRLAAPTTESLRPLTLLANEFRGDLSYDAGSSPAGAAASWAFVRGSDLGLRVIAQAPPGARELVLSFSDNQLRKPELIDPRTGQAGSGRAKATSSGYEIRMPNPPSVVLVKLERASAAELEGGVAEKVDIASEREIPVEEILRRLQAFEDAQGRKLEHYQATNTTHLRFQATAGAAGTLEATLQGDFFFRRGQGFDWAWQELYFNGVRWRGKKLPEIPLIQPEKAAAMPLAIELSKRYSYRLRGSDTLDGRPAWVVEFRPVGEAQAASEKLFRGTVWVDKQIFARLKTQAVQLGLGGEVLSNEETVTFRPLTADGQAGPWSGESYFLPVRTVSQQLWSVINTTTVVERQIELSAVQINSEDFDRRREAALASDATMVRDTPEGMRYLVKQESGEGRVVKQGFDKSKLFAVGGVFYDDSLDYPLPLAGVNYFSFDVKNTGNQLNLFFAGALATVDFAQPRFLGSKFDFGGDAFVFAVPTSEQLFRNNVEAKNEEVKSRTGNVSVLLGHPIGNFVKVELEYEATYNEYQRAGDTAKNFVLPQDGLTHSLKLSTRFARAGYQLSLDGNINKRQGWEFWGLPGNQDFNPDQDQYSRWRLALSKNWYLPKFQRFSAEVDYVGGSNLDRFSKYGFGFFGTTAVHGYQSGRVRAEKAYLGHLRYGLVVGDSFRIEAVADGALATDKTSGLDNEALAGVGLVGQFVGPWNTLIQVDVGTPVTGPDDGFVAYLVFLKLFH
ncbi:MAG TPA: hypothetical protein PK413_05005, partial [Thermoanaerobaculia bacterium]|nr:hypothetical protein [Thermoanaerobaculia bacterium]